MQHKIISGGVHTYIYFLSRSITRSLTFEHEYKKKDRSARGRAIKILNELL